MQRHKPVIVVHGGAGAWHTKRRKQGLEGVKEAADRGFEILKASGTALDAVEEAVVCMEDNEVFNAGLGSKLSIDRRIEMEASIMDGKTLNAGAVGLLKDIRNPVRLARAVMEKTDHVFLVADGAEKLAEITKMERRNPITERKLQDWREMKEKMQKGKLQHLPRLHQLVKNHPDLFDLETVGAVALDKHNNVAAATSTGGFSLKIPGRIGDSPLIGCGTYADNESGGCSATGIGEIAIRLVLAKNVCDHMHNVESAQEAVENSIQLVNRRIKNAVNFIGFSCGGHERRYWCDPQFPEPLLGLYESKNAKTESGVKGKNCEENGLNYFLWKRLNNHQCVAYNCKKNNALKEVKLWRKSGKKRTTRKSGKKRTTRKKRNGSCFNFLIFSFFYFFTGFYLFIPFLVSERDEPKFIIVCFSLTYSKRVKKLWFEWLF